MKTVTVREAHEKVQQGNALLIDVRPQEMYQETHAEEAINLSEKEDVRRTALESKKDVLLICNTGRGSGMMCEKLNLPNVYNVDGGTTEWIKKGLPTRSE